jgi:hypothetical protein
MSVKLTVRICRAGNGQFDDAELPVQIHKIKFVPNLGYLVVF